LLSVGAVALLRRCAWGRVLANIILCLLTLFLFAIALAPTLERSKGPYPFERLLGVTPSTAVNLMVAAVVLLSLLFLGLVYVFSKHKALFRRSLW